MRRHLRFAVPGNTPPIQTVHLLHDGFFRPNPGPHWFPIRGVQHFTVDPPGFDWRGRIRMLPLLWIDARDSLAAGRGGMRIRLNSFFTLVNAHGPEIDQGASARWLAEMVWFPTAFSSDRVAWEPIDGRSARATLLVDGPPVSLIVEFDDEGRAARVRGPRYRAVKGGQSILTPWSGTCADYRNFSCIQAPSQIEVSWDLPEGQFTYARFRVTELKYEYEPPAKRPAGYPTNPHAAAG